MRILLADDEVTSRTLLSATLRKLGHEPVIVENGRQAIEVYRKEQFPLIISDWMMPEMDGLELCRVIRAEKSPTYTYILLLTAKEGTQSQLAGLVAGADDFLTKPFDEELLAARLLVAERLLNMKDVNRRLAHFILICSYCKKARAQQEHWEQLEACLMDQTDVQLSHGICPECYEKTVRPQLDDLRRVRGSGRLG